MKDLVSVIIRTKNEERWITQCLKGVFSQDHRDIEVIIVDNMSTDKTIEKAKQFKVKTIVACPEYLPGKALNIGIKESKGRYVACLSGHCIPAGDNWLTNLVSNFGEKTVAGVYGRQEPMEFTSDSDKRDLALVFGLDKKIQIKDSFFHNANSMIRRDVWDRISFDEKVTNIEDRLWAKTALDSGYKIIYEPLASVYHYHGIHQNGNIDRCRNVVRIMKSIHKDYEYRTTDLKAMNIVAFVPMRGKAAYLGKVPLVSYTLDRLKESLFIKKIIVSTDNAETAALARKLGAETPFMRDPSFSAPEVNLAQVLRHSLEKAESLKIYPDLVVSLETTFPFRPKGLIDDMISQLAENGFDSVVAAKRENKAIWKEMDGKISQLDEGFMPREFKDPTYIELKGIGCVTYPEFIRAGGVLGDNIGIYELKDPYSSVEVRDAEDLKMASVLLKEWIKEPLCKFDSVKKI